MAKFFQMTCEEVDTLRDADLTKNEILAILHLRSIEAFGDNYRPMPTKREFAKYLRVSVATIRRILKKLKHLGLFVFDTRSRFKSVFKNIKVAGKIVRAKFFCPDQDCNKTIKDDPPRSTLKIKDRDCKNQAPEPLPNKDSEIPQTLQTLHTPQTEEEVREKNIEEEVSNEKLKVSGEEEAEDDISTPSSVSETVETTNNIVNDERKVVPAVGQNKYKIPQNLLERLKISSVKTSEQVLVKISQHHISQAYGAITHVENTFATITDPTAIFLYQLPKQPIEKLGQRYSDENLEKQKRECEAIEKERRGKGFMPMSKMPGVAALKAKLAKKTVKKNGSSRLTS